MNYKNTRYLLNKRPIGMPEDDCWSKFQINLLIFLFGREWVKPFPVYFMTSIQSLIISFVSIGFSLAIQ